MNLRVHRYQNFPNETIMSLLVRNENEYIRQWIAYHSALGVTRFIIYDNFGNQPREGTQASLHLLLGDLIQNGMVVLIDWPYGGNMQQTHENHCLYAFRDSSFIGFLDVDEFVNPQGQELYLPRMLAGLHDHPEMTGGFTLLCKIFRNPENLPEDGFEFLRIYNSDEILRSEREKVFVVPRNVQTFSVHMITSGSPSVRVDPNILFFNHYMFLNKEDRAREVTTRKDDSISRVVDRIANVTKGLHSPKLQARLGGEK